MELNSILKQHRHKKLGRSFSHNVNLTISLHLCNEIDMDVRDKEAYLMHRSIKIKKRMKIQFR